MRCGDRGYTNEQGKPCGQQIARTAKACIFHMPGEAGQRRAKLTQQKGALAAKMRQALPATYQVAPFNSVESIIEWAHEMAGKVLKENVDTRRTAEARGFAQLALAAIAARTNQQLVEALLRLEHGGAAFALLARLQDGITGGRPRPLPGRVPALTEGKPA